jgi:integrase
MARQYQMSWIPSQKRWMKMYRRKRYTVSCRQLQVAATKEASWRLANEWWQAKQAELDAAARPPVDGTTEQVVRLLERKQLGITVDEEQEAVGNVLRLLEAFTGQQPRTLGEIQAAADALVKAHRASPLPPGFADQAVGEADARQLDRVLPVLLEGPPAPVDRSVGGQVKRWVATQQALVGAGKITPDRADNNRICVLHFRDFLKAESPLEVVNEEGLHAFFLHCLAKVKAGRERNTTAGATRPEKRRRKQPPAEEEKAEDASDRVDAREAWSVDYAKKVFGVARSFVRFLWEGRLIELPRNIDSKLFQFGSGLKVVRTWTVEQFARVFSKATGQMRLHLLLMANCGMLQTDISDLLDREVDWGAGRLIRKRSKTGHGDEVPLVNYKLWPLTFELLKQYRSGGEVVLLTEGGRRWVDKRMVAGRLVKADNIASCYAWLKRRTKFDKPLKQIRKTSASLIESHREYGRYKDHFLGHSPRGMANRHYAAPSVELFDEIVAWLGKQYGFCD